MTYEEYISLIERRLGKNYSITTDIEERGIFFDYFASSIFISPNTQRYNRLPYSMYEIYEKIYIKHYTEICESDIQTYFRLMCSIASEQAPTYQHLYKSIIGVMICDKSSLNLSALLRKLRYTRPFTLYLRGWSEVQLVLADMSANSVYLNADAVKNTDMFAL